MTSKEKPVLAKLSESDKALAADEQNIIGRSVRDSGGEELGDVDDLLIDTEDEEVRFLVVASGGFLGLGEHKSYIPVDAVTAVGRSEVHIDLTRQWVAGAPKYDPELVEERDYYEGVYGYYGYAPCWSPGYTHRGYPFYP